MTTSRTKAALERQVVRLIAERDREVELSAIAVARAGELEARLDGERGEKGRGRGDRETWRRGRALNRTGREDLGLDAQSRAKAEAADSIV